VDATHPAEEAISRHEVAGNEPAGNEPARREAAWEEVDEAERAGVREGRR
jgi:hypothetical protein